MKHLLFILTLYSFGLSYELEDMSINNALQTKRTYWVSLKGVVEKEDDRKLFLKDSSGRVEINFRRTKKEIKHTIYEKIQNGDSISLIGINHSMINRNKIRVLQIHQNNEEIFKQSFNRTGTKTIPIIYPTSEFSHLANQYVQFYKRKAITNVIIGSLATATSITLLKETREYFEQPISPDHSAFFGVVMGFSSLATLAPALSHSTAGILYLLRIKRTPGRYIENHHTSLSFHFLPQTNTLSLFLSKSF